MCLIQFFWVAIQLSKPHQLKRLFLLPWMNLVALCSGTSLMLVPGCFNYNGFVVSFTNRKHTSSNFVLIFQGFVCLFLLPGAFGSSVVILKIGLSISTIQAIGIFRGIILDMKNVLNSTDIFKRR